MKIIIGILLIGFLISISTGTYLPSSTSLSGFNSVTLANVVDDAINYCVKAAEGLGDIYQDCKNSSKIGYFFNIYLPLDQKPVTIVLLSCGLVGLWGYGRGRKKT